MSRGADARGTDARPSKAIDAKEKALVAACEQKAGSRCSVAAFDGRGLSRGLLIETFELTDIRLVYAAARHR